MGSILKYVLAMILAFMPAFIWLDIFRHRTQSRQRWVSAWLFLAGMASALPILTLYYIWIWYNGIDLYDQITGNIQNIHIATAVAFMIAGSLEEVAKNSVVRYSDTTHHPIKTINEAVKFSIFAALGFAFTENVIYFSNAIGAKNFVDTFVIIMFRSVFTICAHIVFSGILGYYYSIAKFSAPFIEQEHWEGKKYMSVSLLQKIFHMKPSHAYREVKIFEGLIIAATLHGVFNLLLQYQQLQYATLLVVIGFVYVAYLMSRKAGHLLLGYKRHRKSLMVLKDEEVVIELLGMWLNEGKYAEVESIAQRLLERDPDNKVVRIFLAKAHDRKKLKHALDAFKALFTPEDIHEEKNILASEDIIGKMRREGSLNTRRNTGKKPV